jgi:hypothetical protein
METIGKALRQTPADFGLSTNMWDGKTLSAFIQGQFDIDLGVRQSQRLFRQLGFRLRKPRPTIVKADLEKQAEHKKNFRELQLTRLSIYGRLTKSIFNSTVLVVACGFPLRKKILC